MIRFPLKCIFAEYRILTFLSSSRSVRSLAHRENASKLKGVKARTVTDFDGLPHIESYEDYVEYVKQSDFGDELELEKHFTEEDSHGEAIERCDEYYDYYSSQEKRMKSYVKKEIVKRKYFNLDQETNLLTCAAKEQIHFLHKSDPLEWNYKRISECFPISEAGAKKLLKCNFVLKSPEVIKAHDEQVAERWKVLKSGKFTDAIAPLTWKMYEEGKLIDDYFSGNPNLPTTPPPKKVVHIEPEKEIGEFSAIVQTYVNYENKKLLTCDKEVSTEKQLSLRVYSEEDSSENYSKALRKFKYADEEFDYKNSYASKRISKPKVLKDDIPLSQFKEILKEEYQSKSQPYPHINKYEDYESLLEKNKENDLQKQPTEAQDCFVKISKYDRTENVKAMYDRKKGNKIVYMYDENKGYHYLYGKQTKQHLSIKQFQKGKLHKVGQCVYDDNGEFLYKLPS